MGGGAPVALKCKWLPENLEGKIYSEKEGTFDFYFVALK